MNRNERGKYSQKYTTEEILLYIASLGYEMLNFFNRQNIHIIDSLGYKYKIDYYSFKRNNSCSKFHNSNPYAIDNIKLWLNITNSQFSFVSAEYVKRSFTLTLYCPKCEEDFTTSWDSIQTGRGCNKCCGKVISNKNSLFINYPTLLEYWDYDKNEGIDPFLITISSNRKFWWKCIHDESHVFCKTPNHLHKLDEVCCFCSMEYPSSKYNFGLLYPKIAEEWDCSKNTGTPFDYLPKSSKRMFWKCNDCGFQWSAKIESRTIFETDCPNCAKSSKGESFIIKWLIDNNIEYKKEFTFDGLVGKNNKPLRFDFAIFNNNSCDDIKLIIEYDGQQHYKHFSGFQTEENFNLLQQYDKIKNEYCLKNGIKLLRISYREFKRLNEILRKEVS